MSDAEPTDQLFFDTTIGFDATGDPLIHLNINIPEGGGAMSVDAVESLALHLLSTVITARTNAAVARKLMLDGAPPEAAVAFLRQVMGAV